MRVTYDERDCGLGGGGGGEDVGRKEETVSEREKEYDDVNGELRSVWLSVV